MKKYRNLVLVIMLLAVNLANAQIFNGKAFLNLNEQGVILDGYDAVAFFADNKPVKGDPQFQFNYEGAIYYFVSAAHADLFKANPEKYKPQFGGYCAYAVSLEGLRPLM